MTHNKKKLKFYIMADMMMNRGKFKWSFKDRLINIIRPDYIMQYLRAMRYYNFLSNYDLSSSGSHFIHILLLPLKIFYGYKFWKLGIKLGFTIGPDVFDYGLVIPHYGTIVVGGVK